MPAKPTATTQQPRRLTKENINALDSMSNPRKSLDDSSTSVPRMSQPLMRRPSKWDPSLIQATRDRRLSQVSRTSISGASGTTKPGPPVKYENTYKIEPDRKFQSYKAKNVIYDALKEWLTGVEYTPTVRQLTTGLSDDIKKRVKALGFGRYKYVVTVTIIQDAKQSMQVVSRCVWNKDTDTFAEATFKTADVYAIGTVYASYYE